MSQKVCLCGREKSKEKPLTITIKACKNKHTSPEGTIPKADTDDDRSSDEYEKPKKPSSETVRRSDTFSKQKTEQRHLSPIEEKSLTSVSETSTQSGSSKKLRTPSKSDGYESTKRRSSDSMTSSKLSSKSILREPPSNLSKPVDQQDDRSEKSLHSLPKVIETPSVTSSMDKVFQSSSKSSIDEYETKRKSAENHTSTPKSSTKSVTKAPSALHKSNVPSKSSVQDSISPSSQVSEKSLQSLSKLIDQSFDQSTPQNTEAREMETTKEVPQKMSDFSQSVVDQVDQASSPVAGTSLQSLTRIIDTSLEQPSQRTGTEEQGPMQKGDEGSKSSSKTSSKSILKGSSSARMSSKKLSFDENDELLLSNTTNAQIETQSLEDVEEESEEKEEEPVMDHILYCEEDNLVKIRGKPKSFEDTLCGLQSYGERPTSSGSPYVSPQHNIMLLDKKTGPEDQLPTKKKSVGHDVTRFFKNKFSTSSDESLKLPRLPARYHGPGCAMEINVLEKHGKKCSYKKARNPERNPVDDRSGSYDVIGRIMFKTCGAGGSHHDTTDMRKPSNPRLTELYSLLHLPAIDNKTFILSASTSASDQRVGFVTSSPSVSVTTSKSFPNNYRGLFYERLTRRARNPFIDEDRYWGNTRDYDLEELYFSKGKADKSIQMTSESQKKWYYSLFPCIFERSSN